MTLHAALRTIARLKRTATAAALAHIAKHGGHRSPFGTLHRP